MFLINEMILAALLSAFVCCLMFGDEFVDEVRRLMGCTDNDPPDDDPPDGGMLVPIPIRSQDFNK